ncbi:MAG TPA: hypothetical protein VGK54_08790 [Chloroflexota bacterium]|jgi:hypothetical protein
MRSKTSNSEPGVAAMAGIRTSFPQATVTVLAGAGVRWERRRTEFYTGFKIQQH